MPMALVKPPSAAFSQGLTSQTLGAPDYELACEQHQAYRAALEGLGLSLLILDADEHPDSCFVEDMAVLAPDFEDPSRGLLVCTASPVRYREQQAVESALRHALPEYTPVRMEGEARLEGGDVLRLGNQFFVGISERTNETGFRQFQRQVERLGYRCYSVPVKGRVLHLKTGASPLQDNTVLALSTVRSSYEERGCRVIEVSADEWHAANTVCVGRAVVMPAGHPGVVHALRAEGYEPIEVELSEFKKQDGGASCLSILAHLT